MVDHLVSERFATVSYQMTQRMFVLVVDHVQHQINVHAVHSHGQEVDVKFLDVMEYQQMTL